MFPEAKTLVQNVKEYFVKPPDPKELVRKWQARALQPITWSTSAFLSPTYTRHMTSGL